MGPSEHVRPEGIPGRGVFVDIVTSKVKALAFSSDGRAIASAEEEYPLENTRPRPRRAGRDRCECGGDARPSIK